MMSGNDATISYETCPVEFVNAVDQLVIKTEVENEAASLIIKNEDDYTELKCFEGVFVSLDEDISVLEPNAVDPLAVKVEHGSVDIEKKNEIDAVDQLDIKTEEENEATSLIIENEDDDTELKCFEGVFVSLDEDISVLEPNAIDPLTVNVEHGSADIEKKNEDLPRKSTPHQQKQLVKNCDERKLKCKLCGKTFTTANGVTTHVKLRTGVKPNECEYCEKCFHGRHNLTQPELRRTYKKIHICEVCNKVFSLSSNLTIHMRNHTGERPFTCDICDKRFTHQGILKRHLKIHTVEKPYKCKFCKKSFKQSSMLNNHIVQHRGEKRYKCNVCNKSFAQYSGLSYHKKQHDKPKCDKRQKCPICNEVYRHPCDPFNHMRLHMGNRPYQSDVCIKVFTEFNL